MKNLFQSVKDIDPSIIDHLKPLDKHYWNNPDAFRHLISSEPDIGNFAKIIRIKNNSYNQRDALVRVLRKQYIGISDPIVDRQISSLQEPNCYTIICAHQGLLFGGPLYFWYKIAHTIALCNELNNRYKDYKMIPIFYCGLEDHDFEEINHCYFFNKKIEWKSDQSGATGRMNPGQIHEALIQVKSLFLSMPFAIDELDQIEQFLKESSCYADFCRKLIHHLFGKHGLLFFNPDDAESKKCFANEMIDEVLTQSVFHHSKVSCNHLAELGYQTQAHIREINLFYLKEQYRVGIYYNGLNYHTKDLKFIWSRDEIVYEINQHPESFSPNVVLRPLYQELLFPNLFFVGGGAEIAYWLQLKSVFDARSIAYPILWRRFSGIIINNQTLQKIEKLGLHWEDFLSKINEIQGKYVGQNSKLIQGMNATHALIEKALNQHAKHGDQFDQSFQVSLAGDLQRLIQQLEKITQKLMREEKAKHESDLLKIVKLKDTLFPMNGLQERYESGMQYYLTFGKTIVDELINISNSKTKMLALFLNS